MKGGKIREDTVMEEEEEEGEEEELFAYEGRGS